MQVVSYTPNVTPQLFTHGTKLERKAATAEDLRPALEAYGHWREQSLAVEGRSKEDITRLTQLLNEYKNRVEPLFDARPNSAQEILQSSIIEEFLEYLFCRIEKELGFDVLRRPESGYLELIFNPKSIRTLVTRPEYTVRRKDHDFIIGAAVTLVLRARGSSQAAEEDIVVPAT